MVSEDLNLNPGSTIHSLAFPLNSVTSRSSVILEYDVVYMPFYSLPVAYLSGIIYHSLPLAVGIQIEPNLTTRNFLHIVFVAICFCLFYISSVPKAQPVSSLPHSPLQRIPIHPT